MHKLLAAFSETKDHSLIVTAQQLRRNMTKPYRVIATVERTRLEFTFSPLIPIDRIEALVQMLGACKTVTAVEAIVAEFRDKTSLA